MGRDGRRGDGKRDAGRLKWPKPWIELTPRERAVKEEVVREFQEWGYEGLLGWIQELGHEKLESLSRPRTDGRWQDLRSLEIGCGRGHHFHFVGEGQHVGLDIRPGLLAEAREIHSRPVCCGDAYDLPFGDAVFDRVLAIYTLEHLHRLPECLGEIRRVLRPAGELMVGLPAEGGLLFDLGRRLTSKRHFESEYDVDYLRLVRSEHCNSCREVMDEVGHWFRRSGAAYLPFGVPSVHLSAVVVLRYEHVAQEEKA